MEYVRNDIVNALINDRAASVSIDTDAQTMRVTVNRYNSATGEIDHAEDVTYTLAEIKSDLTESEAKVRMLKRYISAIESAE